jgi:thiosulfate/3-mercaptopyruvate sulfurtransferase
MTDRRAGSLPADGSGATASGPLVSAEWLGRHLAEAVVLDATVDMPSPRTDGDYRVASGLDGWLSEHIPGSIHADLVTELADHSAGYHFAHLPPENLAAALQRWGAAPGRPVVVYDQAGCLWAARLWWELRAIGCTARVLNGGLAAWKSAGLPTASGADVPPPAAAPDGRADAPQPCAPRELTGAWADRDDVLAAIRGHGAATLVCALNEDVFSGRTATRYTRRGHIPTSVNVPARALLDDDGLLLEPAALAAAVRPALGLDGGPIILYCGGGISAALLALALAVLGVSEVAIYDGSLEEWTADPALPVEVTP